FFHPPRYYWLMASIWRLAESLDPLVRLKIGTALTSTLGLAHGLVIYAVVRRRFPDKPLIALMAATLMLFLPVQVFTAGYLGNESLNAFFGAACFFAILWVVRDPRWQRGLVLGALLGAAMLTKFPPRGFTVGTYSSRGLW